MEHNRRKILFISNKLWGGGSERVLTTLANEISNNNDVTIISMEKSENYPLKKTIKLLCLDTKNNKIKRIIKIRKAIKEIKPEVIISFEYYMNMQVCIANIGFKNKLIISERNDPKIKGNNYKLIRNILYILADTLVCQTTEAKEYFPNYIQKKSVVILNPLKENLPEPWNGTREKIIVNYCRLESQKNIKLLIDAFEEVREKNKEYKLFIYGEGSEKDSIISYIRNKNLETAVKLFPFDKNIHEKIKKYSMFVSSSNYEGLSNSMIESMAIGLPTICTDCPCGGARMIIDNMENGILVPVGDRDELVKAILTIIGDENLSKKISLNARHIKEKCGAEIIYKQWKKIIG